MLKISNRSRILSSNKLPGVAVFILAALLPLSSLLAEANELPSDAIHRDARGEVVAVVSNAVSNHQAAAVPNFTTLSKAEKESGVLRASDSYLEEVKAHFGIGDIHSELSILGVAVEEEGATPQTRGMGHARYQQSVNGVPVEGTGLVVHTYPSSFTVKSVNGKSYPGDLSGVETSPSVSEREAVGIAVEDLKGSPLYRALFRKELKELRGACRRTAKRSRRRRNNSSSTTKRSYTRCRAKGIRGVKEELSLSVYGGEIGLSLFDESFVSGKGVAVARLVYRFQVSGVGHHLPGMKYVIDATTGEIIRRDSVHQHINRNVWDCTDPFGVDGCSLEGIAGGSANYQLGRREIDSPVGPNPFPSPFNGLTDTDDVFDYSGEYYDYLFDRFGRTGANSMGGSGDGVSVPLSETRAFVYVEGISFLQQYCPNAWLSNGSLSFCSGSASADVVGHELGHVITKFLSPDGVSGFMTLNDIWSEAGMLNESFSDLSGEFLENYINGTTDWYNGTDSVFETLGTGRNISEPEAVTHTFHGGPEPIPYPNRFNDPNFYCGDSDVGGIHINSTVPSHAAYLAAMGGGHNGCRVSLGIGVDKVEQIWYRAYNNYFIADETFNLAYNSLQLACDDLYPFGVCRRLKIALQAVEMDQGGTCSGIPAEPPACRGGKNSWAYLLEAKEAVLLD